MEDLGVVLGPEEHSVLPNPIDTDIFAYSPKPVSQRHRVLSIRPYTSHVYANDVAVEAVLALSKEDWFEELEFLFVGDGPLFEETLEPLRSPTTSSSRGYMDHRAIAALYREYGVALIPTRSDTHGVSRDEAMSAGLVPVTSDVAAVPEFVGPDEGFLTPPEDGHALADAIRALHDDPDRFTRMSAAAAARVRRQAGAEQVIPAEIALLAGER